MRWLLYIAWLITAVATLGSLYFSEVMHIPPCELCWIQRICLYPLAFILAIATYNGFIGIAPYIFPSVLGSLLVSAYHVAIQTIPGWEPIHACGEGISCVKKIDIGLGPITIPILSLGTAIVLLIITCILWSAKDGKRLD